MSRTSVSAATSRKFLGGAVVVSAVAPNVAKAGGLCS